MSKIYKFSAQISVPSGTVTGSVQLQVSNDEVTANYLSLQEPTNWSNLGSPVSLTTSGTSLITQQDSCYRSLRVVFTSSDGGASGLVTVNIMALAI